VEILQGKKSLKSSLKISGRDSFREEGGERFQTIRSGKATRRIVEKCFNTSEFGKFEGLMKVKSRSLKS
jgi:hypothetical protein